MKHRAWHIASVQQMVAPIPLARVLLALRHCRIQATLSVVSAPPQTSPASFKRQVRPFSSPALNVSVVSLQPQHQLWTWEQRALVHLSTLPTACSLATQSYFFVFWGQLTIFHPSTRVPPSGYSALVPSPYTLPPFFYCPLLVHPFQNSLLYSLVGASFLWYLKDMSTLHSHAVMEHSHYVSITSRKWLLDRSLIPTQNKAEKDPKAQTWRWQSWFRSEVPALRTPANCPAVFRPRPQEICLGTAAQPTSRA